MIRFAGVVTVAGLSACLFAPTTARGQSEVLLRMAPEAGWRFAEHTKRVSAGGGSSESATTASAPTFAINPSIGLRRRLPGAFLVGGELEGTLAGQGTIEGTIEPTSSGEPHDVWPGKWDLRDRFGVGGNLLFGLEVGDGAAQAFAFAGIRRIWSEFGTSGVNPETGELGERREQRTWWPSTFGIGLTLSGTWLLDLRLACSRALTEWSVELPGVDLDYGYSASAVTFSAGIGPPR